MAALECYEILEEMETNSFQKENPYLQHELEHKLQNLGGWSALSRFHPKDVIQSDIENRASRGEWVGGTLCLAYLLHTFHQHQLKEPVSLRRVRILLFRTGDRFFEKPPALQALNDAWEEFKTVAHFWAGLFFINRCEMSQITDIEKSASALLFPQAPPSQQDPIHLIRCLLTAAKTFHQFGVSHKPVKSRFPLLNSESLWTFVDLPEWPIVIPRVILPDDMIEMFEDS